MNGSEGLALRYVDYAIRRNVVMGRMELPAALEQRGLQRHCSLVQKACGLEVKYRIRKEKNSNLKKSLLICL